MHHAPIRSLREGDYLTDQRRLFRVVQVLPARFMKRAAILEDCSTLDAGLFSPKELARMKLRRVRSAARSTTAAASTRAPSRPDPAAGAATSATPSASLA